MIKEHEIYRLVAEGKMSREEAIKLLKQVLAGNNISEEKKEIGFSYSLDEEANLRKKLVGIVSNILHIADNDMDTTLSFKDMGVDSISGIEIIRDINKHFNFVLDAVILYDYPNIQTLAKYILGKLGKSQSTHREAENRNEDIHTKINKRDESILEKAIYNEINEGYKKEKLANTFKDVKQVLAEDSKKEDSNFSYEEIRKLVAEITCAILHISREELDTGISFKEMGVDSISGLEIIRDINKLLSLNLDAVVLYDYYTIDKLAIYVFGKIKKNEKPVFEKETNKNVVIGHVENEQFESPGRIMLKGLGETYGSTEKHVLEESNIVVGYDFENIKKSITIIVSYTLHIPIDELTLGTNFKDMGVDSISGVEVIRDINKLYNMNLDAVVLYDYPDISALAMYVSREAGKYHNTKDTNETKNTEVQRISLKSVEEKEQEYLVEMQPGFNYGNAKTSKLKLNSIGSIDSYFIRNENSIVSPSHDKKLKVEEDNAVKKNKSQSDYGKNLYYNTGFNGDRTEIAIIGMSGRYPGANNLRKFWKNLECGVDSITEVPKDRWDIDKYYDPDMRVPNKTYSKLGGFLNDVGKFDPLFFNISPYEAEFMDPQQRMFLEESWKALEDAGYSDKVLSDTRCGVFVGATNGDYWKKLIQANKDCTSEAFTGISSSILAGRISYFLNLKGPSISIDTACSSSLVSIHLACRSILSNDCDMALAGGVAVMMTPDLHLKTSRMGMISPTGKCRTFDNDADGTIFSEGVGVLVLKSLEKAIEDRDYIYGVIKGTGVNQDGKTNGITAPSANSQMSLELEVYRRAGINPENISYVEAHGTGTSLGDPIEVKALKDAFAEFTDKKQFCAIGSVKTNIGHTTMAAGVASVIKVLLAMKHKKIPPLLNFKKENEHIDFVNTPFYVNTELRDWVHPKGVLRLATVSSFGFSGTNCHIVIQEPNQKF